MPINLNLTDELDEKKNKIEKSPNYFLKRANQVKKDLRVIGDIHSFWLENPEMRKTILRISDTDNPHNLRRKARECIAKIQTAWTHLNQYNDLQHNLTPEIIVQVGKRIDPYNSSCFRNARVSLGFTQYTPPNPVKVDELISKFCTDLTHSEYHPVEAAAVTHLNIAGIQPFLDGNKRTARLLQDKILVESGFPPAIIPAGERHIYLDLLEQGLVGMRDGDFKAQRPFFDYIGGKVNVALDKIINDLN